MLSGADIGAHGNSTPPLRRLRKAAGLTQTALASAIQRTQSYVSAIERGEVVPTVRDIERLNTIFGTDLGLYFVRLRKGRA